MKFKLVVFIIFVLCILGSEIESRRISSTSRRRTHHKNRQNPPAGVQSNNVVYQFLMGALAEISGAYSLIDGCSKTVPGWATVTADNEEKNGTLDKDAKDQESKWDKILGYLGTAINYVCQLKDQIIDFFTKSIKRYMRLFLQGKTRRRFRWSFGDFFTSAANKISEIGSGIAAGARKIGETVVDGVDWAKKKAADVTQYIKDKLQGLIQPIMDLFETFKAKFQAFLEKNPILKTLFDFVKCFLTNDGIKTIKGLKETLTNFVSLISGLSTPAGWIKLLVNLICGWESLRDGIAFFKTALKQTAKPAKYNFYGRFIGKVMKAMLG